METTPYKRTVRSLYGWEIEAARLVFGTRLNYERVHVHEATTWPDRIDQMGRKLKKMEASNGHNAITLGYNCIFPVRLPDYPVGPQDARFNDLCWLIHELTHAWQFEQMGWSYLVKAITAQLRGGAMAYDFGGIQGLILCRAQGWKLQDFNLEQQGDIARSYYYRLCRGENVACWLPYIEDIQRPAKFPWE